MKPAEDTEKQYSNLIEQLPLELLSKVLLNLDCFALRSLFQASSYVSRQCVLIREKCHYDWRHYFDPLAFFMDSPDLRVVDEYIPSKHKAHVKIFMAAYIKQGYKDTITKESLDARFPHLNPRDSIVFYFTPNFVYSRVSTQMLLTPQQELAISLVQAKIAFHVTPLTPKETLVHTLDDATLSVAPPKPTKMLYSLIDHLTMVRLEGLETIEGISFHQVMRGITLLFHKCCKNPVIRNLTFPAESFDLSIYYEDRVPYIEDLHFPDENFSNCLTYAIHSTLILGHVPSLPGHLTTALPIHPDETRDLNYLSVLTPIKSQFANIKIIGGPNSIVDTLDTYLFEALEWKQSCEPYQQPGHLAIIDATMLMDFKFESLCQNARFPLLQNTNSDLSSISITAHHGLDISALLPIPLALKYLNVYVNSNDPTDYVPSVAEIWPSLVLRGEVREEFFRLVIAGLRWEPPYTPDQLRGSVMPNGVFRVEV